MSASGKAGCENFRARRSTRHSGCSPASVSITWPTSAPTNCPAVAAASRHLPRANSKTPDLLLVDEPTASLRSEDVAAIMRLIKELCAERELSAHHNIPM